MWIVLQLFDRSNDIRGGALVTCWQALGAKWPWETWNLTPAVATQAYYTSPSLTAMLRANAVLNDVILCASSDEKWQAKVPPAKATAVHIRRTSQESSETVMKTKRVKALT